MGPSFVKARCNLGLQRASYLICIKQNDRLARGKPADLGDLDLTHDTMDVPAEAGGVYGVVRLSPPAQPARMYCSWALQRAALAENIW